MMHFPYAALLVTLASAATTPKRHSNEHLKLDFSVLRGNSGSAATKGGREEFVSKGNYSVLELGNALTYYAATVKVGSNGDENTLLLDTGSSDLWVMSNDVSCYLQPSLKRSLDDMENGRFFKREVDQTPAQPIVKRADYAASKSTTSQALTKVNAATCTSQGSFNTDDSLSFKANSSAPPFGIEYADLSFANGTWGTDYVAVGSLNVSDCNIAVVNDTTSDYGVFGIGFAGLEVTSSFASNETAYTYENFPIRLKNTGVINKLAYSLYLNEFNSSSGSVLFGAVDHAKYSGQLQTVPIVNVQPLFAAQPISFDVKVDSVTVEGIAQNVTVDTAPFAGLLDSGTTLTYLPVAIVDSIASSLHGKYSKKAGAYEVSCNYNTSSANLVYNLSGVEIRVPLSDLIMNESVFGEKTSKCYLGLVPQDNSTPYMFPEATLGDNFLRHAYVVYNLEDYEISLAPVRYTNSSDIEVISSSIPSAVKAPGYSSTSLLSSIVPQATGSHLSTAGLTKSEGSTKFTYVKSLALAISGVALLFIL